MSVNERWLEILLTPLRDGITVADTCRRYGVSRQSFYDYRRRLNTEAPMPCNRGLAVLAPHRGRRTPWSKRGSWRCGRRTRGAAVGCELFSHEMLLVCRSIG
ncbi:hypothetical protein B2J88_47480 [Rhodococcus sp. SRB_17]|nr:hypothetical protein [Rhodococcus sp. SRB_17]